MLVLIITVGSVKYGGMYGVGDQTHNDPQCPNVQIEYLHTFACSTYIIPVSSSSRSPCTPSLIRQHPAWIGSFWPFLK